MLLDVQRVDHRDDAVKEKLLLQILFDEEALRDRTRVGKAGGLDHDVVESIAALQ